MLHVFGSMDRGGAELRTLEVLRRTAGGPVVQEFCVLSGRPGVLADEIRRLGGEVHPCSLGPGFPLRFARLIARRRIDLVHSHVQLTSGMVLTLAAAAGVRRRIAHFRSTADDRGQSLPRRGYRIAMRRLLDAAATDIVGVSAGVLEEAWSPHWRQDPRCRVVYSGVDGASYDLPDAAAAVRVELGLPTTTPLIVQVARFNPPKNQTWAVDIMADLVPSSDAHLVFVGRGGTPDEAATVQRIKARGVGNRIHFAGERPDVARFLCAADVSLLTSEHEGLPGVVLESLAGGTPVVATDLSGVREIGAVLPGVYRHALDEPASVWAEELRRLLAAPPTPASRQIARARFAESCFSIDSAVRAHLDLWTARGPGHR